MRALYVILGAYIFVHAHVSGVRVLSLPGPLRANAGNTAAMASRAPCDHHARQDSRINFGPCLQTRHLQKKAMASLGIEGATPVVTQLLGHEGWATSKVQPLPPHAHEQNAFRVATGATDSYRYAILDMPARANASASSSSAAGIGGTPAVLAALSVPAVQEALGKGSGVRGVGCYSHP